ncbi:GNAT family N-acetyltransferase [Tenggerimyces flavus]|uniref:GNAT family N-acetyltransferase n=1 Tax=Tenggerimyces flavus TaxID=1708749 RepID=A0ABV7Y9X7_9ACTN|nr:GNAT family N-acetyltransferase [Tenggerimyces flavus]MBM7783610.1 GNAT superfamily N-acetyltransferase [Tenggerimyces flavus]
MIEVDGGERARAYRDAYTEQVRGQAHEGDGRTYERSGPVVRSYGNGRPGFVGYQDLQGLAGDELDTFINEQRDFFKERNEEFEWKYHGYDLPADLPERLVKAGLTPDDEEMIMIGEAADLATDAKAPAGTKIRQVDQHDDFVRIAAMETEVWGFSHDWLVDHLAQEVKAGGIVLAAEAEAEAEDGKVVSAAWLHLNQGTEFAGLWGGSTLQEWRGRGIYKALVAARAHKAVERGFRYLQSDTSEDSRPILARLGLLPVATTTPYNWRP